MLTKPGESIMLEIPEQFESERLIIRAPQWGDGVSLNEAVRESDAELKPWMPWAQTLPTVEQSEATVRRARLRFLERSDLMLLLFHKETGQLVGSSGLHRIDWQARSFEIGYWARTPMSGKGYISEAVAAITAFAIAELRANRVDIRCDSRNLRSAGVAKRLGFTFEGVLRNNACDVYGGLRNTNVYSKVRGVEFG